MESLSGIWTAIAPAVGNHLWQSTLFAAVAGTLTLALRKNQARIRYRLWLAASVKFFIPFSLLISLGGHLARPRSSVSVESGLYSVAEELSQPFTRTAAPVIVPVAHAPHADLLPLLRGVLMIVWLCGFVAALGLWWWRWRRFSAAMRGTVAVSKGREVDALRRLEQLAGVRTPIALLFSKGSLEPGVFGILRPALVWPAGVSQHLANAHLDAIIAHEVWHVRRRDNLAAAIHMVVEAIFWFHPLVWWLGARLIEERERACDEEVLQLGNPPQVYAESILKTCEFCIGSPLVCVSGVTGANLKSRIIRIMSEPAALKLDLGKKILLLVAGAMAAAGPIVFGLINTPHFRAQPLQASSGPLPSFEVATIKPSQPGQPADHVGWGIRRTRFVTTNMMTKDLIKFAYNFNSDDQFTGGPGWVSSERYDIDAKEEDSLAEKLNKLPPEQQIYQIRLMVQSLLVERFHLKVSRETKQVPVYALVVAKGGAKLKSSTTVPAGSRPSMKRRGNGNIIGSDAPMSLMTDLLSRQPEVGGRVVLDETGLKGYYDWTLRWEPQSPAAMLNSADAGQGAANTTMPDVSGPSLFAAIQEQLGVKLESQKGPVEVLIIDHIERPSEN
jgi:bla regulator protein blaR1